MFIVVSEDKKYLDAPQCVPNSYDRVSMGWVDDIRNGGAFKSAEAAEIAANGCVDKRPHTIIEWIPSWRK